MISSPIYSPQQLALIDKTNIPHHVAIIPDGNRRWAQRRHERSESGHRSGANVIVETVKAAKELGVKAITFYLFSTENWSRSPEEIAALMWLLQEFLYEQCPTMQADGVRLQTIGNLAKLPNDALKAIEETKHATENGSNIDMILALNYGSRDEICRAFHRILDDCLSQKITKEQINEELISRYLDTTPWGDPDLFIRTSGENRVSNFLLWQLSYTELYICEALWPDFTPNHFLDAIIDFQKRDRRLGGT